MIYRELNIPKYNWLVHIFYHVTCYWTDEIMDCLKSIGCPPQKLKESYRNLEACKLNTGLTHFVCSSGLSLFTQQYASHKGEPSPSPANTGNAISLFLYGGCIEAILLVIVFRPSNTDCVRPNRSLNIIFFMLIFFYFLAL